MLSWACLKRCIRLGGLVIFVLDLGAITDRDKGCVSPISRDLAALSGDFWEGLLLPSSGNPWKLAEGRITIASLEPLKVNRCTPRYRCWLAA